MINLDEILTNSYQFDQNDIELIKNNGVVFTPTYICDNIIEKLDIKITDKVCEPSVGKGVFVFSLLNNFLKQGYNISDLIKFIETKLYCYDINQEFLDNFKINLNNYIDIHNKNKIDLNLKNIKCEDFLLSNEHYDVILGNPPYVRIQNLDNSYLDTLKNELVSIRSGNIDLYYAFVEKTSKNSDRFGFIIPNSFIKTKSGRILRKIIKDSVCYIYNNEHNKIWNNISTYTCIIICDKNKTDNIAYETKIKKLIVSKSDLDDGGWVFNDETEGEYKISAMLNSYNCSIQTSNDKLYKIDSYDDEFCYKDGYKIEKNICKKYLKVSKDKSFDDFKYMIYPYTPDNEIKGEITLKYFSPFAYKYLLDIKDSLQLRDGGNTEKYEAWYAYGRRQGLIMNRVGKRIALPNTFLKSRNVHYIEIPDDEDCLVISGLILDIKEEYYDNFIDIIQSDKFNEYCETHNKILPDKEGSDDLWLTISTTTFKNFYY